MKKIQQSKKNPSNKQEPIKQCIGIIGDIVGSRQLGIQRSPAQEDLLEILKYFNKKYHAAILSKFIVTTGDEFQGLLKKAYVIPDIIWDLEIMFKYADVRIGIGYGNINTALKEFSIGMDGPVWYAARDAIKDAYSQKRFGGVFKNFGDSEDKILNGLARLLHNHRKKLTEKQLEVISLLRRGLNQVEIGDELSITKQAVHQRMQSVSWGAYNEGEIAWRCALSKYDLTNNWIDK